MARLGTVLRDLTGAVRINYAIFGNLEPALHAHVFPRRDTEPETLRTAHPWAWDWSQAPAFDRGRDGRLAEALRAVLTGTLAG
jgi:diadenosine tetraphosphate (Ap4A) HIT family hydrolase